MTITWSQPVPEGEDISPEEIILFIEENIAEIVFEGDYIEQLLISDGKGERSSVEKITGGRLHGVACF